MVKITYHGLKNMSTRKIFLSFGCSHTAGSEIDGRGDSDYNRQHSYGAKLAEKFGYDEHLNFAICGGSNQRTFVLTTQVINEIIHNETSLIPYNDAEYFLLIGWTSLNRFELRYSDDNEYIYKLCGAAGEKVDQKLIPTCIGMSPQLINEKDLQRTAEFIPYITNPIIMADYLASFAFSVQQLCDIHGIKYYMFNAIENFHKTDGAHPKFTKDQNKDIVSHLEFQNYRPGNLNIYKHLDRTRYYHPDSYELNYYRWCTNVKGHSNKSNKYWHLGEEAHQDWADHIYPEIVNAYPDMG